MKDTLEIIEEPNIELPIIINVHTLESPIIEETIQDSPIKEAPIINTPISMESPGGILTQKNRLIKSSFSFHDTKELTDSNVQDKELKKSKKTVKPTPSEIYAYDIAIFLDSESNQYVIKENIPIIELSTGITFSAEMFIDQPLLYYDQTEGKKIANIIKRDDFWNTILNNKQFNEQNIKELRFKIYKHHFKRIPDKLATILLWVRFKMAYSVVMKIKNPHLESEKDYVNAMLIILMNALTLSTNISQMVLLMQLYFYGSSINDNSDASGDFVQLFIIRLLAVTSPYLIAYSSSIELLLNKDSFQKDNFNKHPWYKKVFMLMIFTFYSPIYFLYLLFFGLWLDIMSGIVVFFVPEKYFESVSIFLNSLLEKMGMSSNEYEGMLNQRSISQLMFQNVFMLIFDTMLILGKFSAPGFTQSSSEILVINYCLTIFNIIKTITTLYLQSKFFRENFITYALLCMKAKFGWLPFLTKIRHGLIADKFINYEMIKRPNPLITSLLGAYESFKFQFTELTIRKLIEELTSLELNWKCGDPIQEIKIGRSLKKVSFGSIGNLISVLLSRRIIVNFDGMNWDNCIKKEIKKSENASSLDGKWKALTPKGESIVSLVIRSEDEDKFHLEPLLKALIKHHADMNLFDSKGFTPLTLAIKEEKLRSAELLLSLQDVDVNKSDISTYQYPLDIAVENSFIDNKDQVPIKSMKLIKMLLLNGANPYQLVYNEMTQKARSIFAKTLELMIGATPQILNIKYELISTFIEFGCAPKSDEDNIILLESIAKAYATGNHQLASILESAIPSDRDYTTMVDEEGNNFLHMFFRHLDYETNVEDALIFIRRNPDLSLETMIKTKNFLNETPISHSLKYKIDLILLFGLSHLIIEEFLEEFHNNDEALLSNLMTYILQILKEQNDENLIALQKVIDMQSFRQLMLNAISLSGNFMKNDENNLKNFQDRFDIVIPEDIMNMMHLKFDVYPTNQNENNINKAINRPISYANSNNSHFYEAEEIPSNRSNIDTGGAPKEKSCIKINTLSFENLDLLYQKCDFLHDSLSEDSLPNSSSLVSKPTQNLKTKSESNPKDITNFGEILINLIVETTSFTSFITDATTFYFFLTNVFQDWIFISFLSIISTYLVSYAPMVSFYIERKISEEVKAKTIKIKLKAYLMNKNKSKDGAMPINPTGINSISTLDFKYNLQKSKTFWGKLCKKTSKIFHAIIFLSPLCLLYFLFLDLAYIFVALVPRMIQLFLKVITLGKADRFSIADKYITSGYGWLIKLNYMDIKGLRKLKTLSQIIFETLPQTMLQLRILSFGQDAIEKELNMTFRTVILCIIFAVLHISAAVSLLIIECKASKTTIPYYLILCLNGRLNWVPFAEKLTSVDIKKTGPMRRGLKRTKISIENIYDYDNMKFRFCGESKIDYEFYESTVDRLSNMFSNLPIILNSNEQPIIELGNTCNNLHLIKLLPLLKLGWKKVTIKANWETIVKSSYPLVPLEQPIDSDGEYVIATLVQTESIQPLKYFLVQTRGLDPNVISLKTKKPLVFYVVENKLFDILSLLLEYDVRLSEAINGKTLLTRTLENPTPDNFTTVLGLFLHPKVTLSNQRKTEALETVVMLIKKEQIAEALVMLDMLGGLDSKINHKSIMNILEKRLSHEMLNFLRTKVLPEKTSITFEFMLESNKEKQQANETIHFGKVKKILIFNTNILRQFKTLRNLLPGLYYLSAPSEFIGKNQIKLKVNSYYFQILYDLASTGRFLVEHLKPNFELYKLDNLANKLCLEGQAFYNYHQATSLRRKHITFECEIKFEQIFKIPVGELPDVPFHKMEDTFIFLHKFKLPNNAVAIKNMRLQATVEFDKIELFEFDILLQTKSDSFFEQIFSIVAKEREVKFYHDGTQSCLNSLELPVNKAEISLYLIHGSESKLQNFQGTFSVVVYCSLYTS